MFLRAQLVLLVVLLVISYEISCRGDWLYVLSCAVTQLHHSCMQSGPQVTPIMVLICVLVVIIHGT